MEYIIDYCMFRLKKDGENGQNLELKDILNLLGLTADDFSAFTDVGAHNFYKHTYLYNNMRIYVPGDDTADKMGFLVEMSGTGCRYLESMYYKKNNTVFSWSKFFNRIFKFCKNGYDFKLNRIDFAFDDYNKKLNLDVIERCAKQNEVVTLFRRVDFCEDFDTVKFGIRESLTKRSLGKTVYFGSKKSNCFCRFYDKRAEQMRKYNPNSEEYKKIENMEHWVRFEIVFKREIAVRLFMSMITLNEKDFTDYLDKLINSYIRFINCDDSNVSRCSIKKWWSDFIGTVQRAKLTVAKKFENYFFRCQEWIENTLSNTLLAYISNVGFVNFYNLIMASGDETKWKNKHREIANYGKKSYTDIWCERLQKQGWTEIALSEIPLDVLEWLQGDISAVC